MKLGRVNLEAHCQKQCQRESILGTLATEQAESRFSASRAHANRTGPWVSLVKNCQEDQLVLLTFSSFYFSYLNGLWTRAIQTHKVSIILHLSIPNWFSQQLTSIHYKHHCIWLHLLLEFIARLSPTLLTNTNLLWFSFSRHPT